MYDNEAYLFRLNNINLESGRLKKDNRLVLQSIYTYLDEEE